MIKKIFVVYLIFILNLSVFACELPKGESMKIGCTHECSFIYKIRLQMTSWSLGYSTEIIDLEKLPFIKDKLAQMDGILIPGGADIDPKYYLNRVTPELQEYTNRNLNLVQYSDEGKLRDPFEFALVQYYSHTEELKDIPMLGICRGFQMMAVAEGIPLYLDIKTELKIKNRKKLFDTVSVMPEASLMSSLYSKHTVRGYKNHHQGIRVPYYLAHQSEFPTTKVTAYSHDKKIAEAIEFTHRPALGVQYHPEKSFTNASRPIFKWFLQKACEHKNILMKGNP